MFYVHQQSWPQWFPQCYAVAQCREDSDGAYWNPAVDIEEKADAYVLRAELPGVAAENLRLTEESGVLTITAERNNERSESSAGYRHVERRTGRFVRRFRLPFDETCDIKAAYRDGVLEVRIPKQEPPPARSIAIQCEA